MDSLDAFEVHHPQMISAFYIHFRDKSEFGECVNCLNLSINVLTKISESFINLLWHIFQKLVLLMHASNHPSFEGYGILQLKENMGECVK